MELQSESLVKSALFQCLPDGSLNNMTHLTTESTASDYKSLLVGCTRNIYRNEGPRKRSIPTKVNSTQFRIGSSSTSAFTNPRRKRMRVSKNENQLIESSGKSTDDVVLVMSPGSCFYPLHKSGSVKPKPPYQWQTLHDKNPAVTQGRQNNMIDCVRNESIFCHNSIGGTIKYSTPFVRHEFQSISSDSISDKPVSGTETGEFFLDLPTKAREYYFNDISTGKISRDEKLSSNSPFPTICDFRHSSSHQIERDPCFTPMI